ncbi:hypothetical protein BDR22DRAFT_823158 [Usnea florida]
MPARGASKAFRVRGLDSTLSTGQFQEIANRLSCEGNPAKRRLFLSQRAPSTQVPTCTLASQDDCLTGVVSFASAETKNNAIKAAKDIIPDWQLDDTFDGLTILHTPDSIDIDVCAVHGLGGNALDTWTASTKNWLTDFLPKSSGFERARIMTFGYNSTLIDRRSNDRLQDWADDLLRQIGHARHYQQSHQRPVVFICHSLGGLVGREAMIRLNTQPSKFDGVKLENCGLLFLSTPHSGTTQADWNDFLLNLSELVLGVRNHEIVHQLQSFNTSSVDSEEAFSTMKIQPPFHCFCEGEKTWLNGKSRTVVTQASASFCGRTADKILNADHHGVCKFEHKFGGYIHVLHQLGNIRMKLLTRTFGELSNTNEHELPGAPSLVAPHYPPVKGSKWYEGFELRNASQLIGRVETLEEIMDSLRFENEAAPRLIALTGIGGIGKTEILLEVALRFKAIANVFLIHADDLKSLETAFRRIAEGMGHDLLASRYTTADIAAIWRGFGPSEMVSAFKAWLGDPVNQPVLFIVDDLDRLKDAAAIREALPREAQIILCSTRDPSIVIESMDRIPTQFKIQSMGIEETISLLRMVLRRNNVTLADIGISASEVEAIARTIDGHALAACRAISYIVNVIAQTPEKSPGVAFLDMMNGPDWQARSQFLHYKQKMGPSLMETFNVSLQRLPGDQVSTIRFLELLAFLSCKDQSLDYRSFLGVKRTWLQELRPDLPDFDIFALGKLDQAKYSGEIENVSIGFRTTLRGPLLIHPLWIECIQQRAGQEGCERWIRQILLLCLASWTRGESEAYNILRPFACNAIDTAKRFKVRHSLPFERREFKRWYLSFNQPDGSLPVPNSNQPKNDERSIGIEVSQVKEPGQNIGRPSQAVPLYDKLSALLNDCEWTAEAFKTEAGHSVTEETASIQLPRLLTLLQRLRAIEEAGSELNNADAKMNSLHLKVYDSLIAIAPSFRHRSPTLVYSLSARRQERVRR